MLYEQLDILSEVIKRNTDKKWVDTLYKNIEFLYNKMEDMEGDPFFAAKMADTLHIPLPKEKAAKEFESPMVGHCDTGKKVASMLSCLAVRTECSPPGTPWCGSDSAEGGMREPSPHWVLQQPPNLSGHHRGMSTCSPDL